jgi:hypothetical protein
MIVLRGANLTLSFLLELGMLAAFGYWGYQAGSSFWVSVLLGVLLPVVAAVIWAVFMAPKARYPLTRPWHVLLALVLFGLATAGLFAAGQTALAITFGALVILNQVLTAVFHQ